MNKPDDNLSADQSLPLLTHLVELRQRLLRCTLIVLIFFCALFSYSTEIFTQFMHPMLLAMPQQTAFLASGTLAPFVTPFKLTFYLALFITMPFILHQIWGFVSPGLYQKERRLVMPLLIASIILFYAGVAFAYFLVIPVLFKFMASITIPGVTYMPDITSSLDLILNLFLGFGIAFEVPVATLLLIITGITTPQSLADKRAYIIVGVFVIAAILTPPDVLSQVMMAIPMLLLFESALFIGRLLKKNETPDVITGN
jgi:sec-independent protein translocase protein TatC